ncbi:hypothetical protein [Hyunsoonleella pacifica]|uniref:Cadherin domain-containing protein n=1 Tax=Hyunsoonleella pacifica TaxID=1080224 RepID=A0A4Q9FRG1_9FLAO|nr:hypothetical protein [Hyunsoonleella pacifica]TBN18658.1 hypothetical protein EYD46_00910 [Hyunsoonleella pacifica]GGD03611.1 hypothetical protein GCM10011368_01810 [Hyunsoonleella pacifica]
MMKTTKLKLLGAISLIFALILIASCDNDDSVSVDSIPEFQSLIQEISSLPGEEFLFEGIITDPAGIKTVNFKYESWFLDKTIVKDSLPETYIISYKFKVPDDAEDFSVHTIPVTITNAGDVETTRDVIITLDKDISAPTITINSPVDGATVLIGAGNEIQLNIDLADRELAELAIESDILNETIPVSGASFNYSNDLDVANPGNYTLTITATDATGNEATATVSVSVVTDLQFGAMFLTDETNDAALGQDIFGIPFTTEGSQASGEDGYVFTGRYYSSTANSEVRFIPQAGSFEPFAFGANPNTPGQLVLGQDANVAPIVIPNVGYYEITMDVRDLSYTITPYTPTDTAFDQVYILGRGIYIDATTSTCTNNNDGSTQCWHFNSGKPFTQDSNNSYLWTIDVTLQDQPNDNGANGFILNANTSGWAPFWRVDVNGGDPSKTIPGGGNNYVFDDSVLDKDYTFIFDSHLNRIIAKDR